VTVIRRSIVHVGCTKLNHQLAKRLGWAERCSLPDLNNPAALTDFTSFLINQVNALNEIVVRLATEIDTLRGT
jgi:hypothetical protein